MTEELRTFDKIFFTGEGPCCTDSNSDNKAETKKEAIKWLKELLKKHPELRVYPYDLQYSITWIKHFFNITDEDLK
jgi:hypothetical protein